MAVWRAGDGGAVGGHAVVEGNLIAAPLDAAAFDADADDLHHDGGAAQAISGVMVPVAVAKWMEPGPAAALPALAWTLAWGRVKLQE